MLWLNRVVDEVAAAHPEGEIIIESGSSPSGTYHLGHLRELITCDAILLELKRRGRLAKHIAYVDDLDALRKIPVNVPSEYQRYLGMSLCDIPAPNGGQRSYAEHFLQGFIEANSALNMDIEYIRTHQKYRTGFFVPAIERSLERADEIRPILENVSGHKLGEEWSPIQINEDGYLKKRRFLGIDTHNQTIKYQDKDDQEQSTGYAKGEVKLDWRVDWPARWWLLGVAVEPFGRDHATKGGSYDTGATLSEEVFSNKPPLPVAYDFVNLAGDTKKMSASMGTGLEAAGITKLLPPEVIRFFMLRYPPNKRLYFDPVGGVSQLIDEYASLLAKKNKSEAEQQLVDICNKGIKPTVSTVPFTHLVASYQAVLRNPDKTIGLLEREQSGAKGPEQEVIKKQLKFVDRWLKDWAPKEIKFELAEQVSSADFDDNEKELLRELAQKIVSAPPDAGGEWFHKAIYELKESRNLTPEQIFKPLYKALINQESGPRAGWFLSILPRDWLIKRLNLEG